MTRNRMNQENRREYQRPQMIALGRIVEQTGVCSEGCGFDNTDGIPAYVKGCSSEIE